jgi:hypothetical protein
VFDSEGSQFFFLLFYNIHSQFDRQRPIMDIMAHKEEKDTYLSEL